MLTQPKYRAAARWVFWAVFGLLWLALIVLMGMSGVNNPRPTDDMFYIDAAWNLQNGSYAAPSPIAPYPHYLRWPVVLPLAAVLEVFGASAPLFRVFTMGYVVMVSAALVLVAMRFTTSRVTWAAAGLTPLLLPAYYFQPRVLSEYAAMAWFCVGLVLVAYARGRRHAHYMFWAGVSAAIAINAAHVSVFATPALAVLAWRWSPLKAPPVVTALRTAGVLAIGAVAASAAIALGEWIALGDPFIQIRAVSWWLPESSGLATGYLSELFDPRRQGFLFGYASELLKRVRVLVPLLVALALVARRGRHEQFTWVVVAGLVGWLSFEILSPLVVDKVGRYVAIPMLLALFGLVAGAAETLRQGEPRSFTMPAITLLLLFALFNLDSNVDALLDDPATTWHRDVFRTVVERIDEIGTPADDVAVFVALKPYPGLIPVHLAAYVYTDYRVQDQFVFGAIDKGSALAGHDHQFAILDHALPPVLAGAGFEELLYDDPTSCVRPRVFERLQ